MKGLIEGFRRRFCPPQRPPEMPPRVVLTHQQMQELGAMIQQPFQELIDELKQVRADLKQTVTDGIAAAEATKDQDVADGIAGVRAELDGLKSDVTAAATTSAGTGVDTIAAPTAADTVEAGAADSLPAGLG